MSRSWHSPRLESTERAQPLSDALLLRRGLVPQLARRLVVDVLHLRLGLAADRRGLLLGRLHDVAGLRLRGALQLGRLLLGGVDLAALDGAALARIRSGPRGWYLTVTPRHRFPLPRVSDNGYNR